MKLYSTTHVWGYLEYSNIWNMVKEENSAYWLDPDDIKDKTTDDYIDFDTDNPFIPQPEDNESAAAEDVPATHIPNAGPPLTPVDQTSAPAT